MTHPIPSTPPGGFTVATPEVRRSGAAVAEAAAQLRRIRPHADLAGIASGMPESDSARAAAGLASVWEESFDAWTAATGRHARALRLAADDYDSVEGQVAAALDGQPARWEER